MRTKPYYSVRVGKHPSGGRLDLALLRELFFAVFQDFESRDFFRQLTGFECVDQGYVAGVAGLDINAYVLRKLRKSNLWPISTHYLGLTEDDVFDLIEFLYDHVSEPLEGNYHSFGDCGWHYGDFDRTNGRGTFLTEMNELLRDYEAGYELSSDGEVLSRPMTGLAHLLAAKLISSDPQNVEERVAAATRKFRSRHASSDDRRGAVRDLADVLEFLRPKAKDVLSAKDEQDLFNIANNFAIRHHNSAQKSKYDKPIWYSWMFYVFLATIHAVVRLTPKVSRRSSRSSAL